ncbi:MAG: transposase [Streptomyces sp.]
MLPGASWQRCRTHYARNLLCQVPKSARPVRRQLVRSITGPHGSPAGSE